MSVLSEPRFHEPAAALAHLEAVLWPNGPTCPHCGAVERIYELKGKSTKPGVRKCGHCLKLFTVTVGTVFESSHVPLNKWLQAVHLLCSGKKGISSHQLHRTLEVTYKTAWFMSHRIREAMKDGSLGPLGGEGATIEADETFIGRRKGVEKPKGGPGGMRPIMALVERGGSVRSFHVEEVNSKTAKAMLDANADPASALMTDEGRHYRQPGKGFASHERVHHARGEYVRGKAHTNTIEGFFGVFKRGMKGTYQHCGKKHLHRYLAEFDFRHNARSALGVNDAARAERALRGIVGKRLTYRRADAGNVP
jgi:transposase-like protein